MQIKHLIILLTILILITPPVSAGVFGDIFNEITGKVTENVGDVEPEPVPPVEPEPEDSEPVPLVVPEPEESVPPVEPEPEDSMPAPPVMPEPVPPVDVCSAVLKSQWCSEGEILCPQKKDENGCIAWDCDSCERCKPIQISQPSCPDGKTLCPEGKDERGCGIWDCSVCEKLPDEECQEIAITRTCPDCEGLLEDCLCPKEKDERGCLFWDCDSCETKPPIDVPDGCRKITLENGIEVIECEKECLAVSGDIKEKCKESGGKVVERTDHHGCPFVECEYEVEDPEECPAHEVLEARRMACLNQGLEPMIVRRGECDTIKCSRAEPDQRCSEDVELKKRIKDDCEKSGGEIVKYFDNVGCPVTVCIHPEQEECSKDIPQEAYKNCELEEGDLMVKRDSQGCLVFAECVKRGKKEIEYEEIEEMPSAATLLSIALKLESLKIDFDKLVTKVSSIAEYYENTGNEAEATKFRKVAGLFSGAQDKIEEIKVKFRENAKDMTEEDLRELKYDMKYISEVIMQDALYIILGGEIEVDGTIIPVDGGYPDCGSNDRCWEEAVRLCEPVVFRPNNGPSVIAKIHGLDNEVCIIEADGVESGEGHSMLCKVPNYATINTDGPEILEFCEGSMVEWIESGQKPAVIEGPRESGRCVDRCGDRICQGVVCMADGCPCSESPESCPEDCRAMPTKFKLCTEDDEKAWDLCQDEGGNPQTDPSRYGDCEIYTHCTVPYLTIAECEMISDIDIRNGCYIKIADMTGNSSVCVRITKLDRKDKCYVKAATTSRDRSICENIIGDEDIKEHCYSSISEEEKKIIKRPPEIEGEIVFTEDFEDGTENWFFYPAGDARPGTGWGTAVIEGNTVLRGTDHNWVDLVGVGEWTNYIFKARFKIISGTMHFNYRLHKDGIFRRYYVGVSDHGMYLTRSTPPGHINLFDDVRIQLDDNWHNFKMVGYDNILNIYIDDELFIEYKDVGTPALPGTIAFETLGGAEFLIDDIEIQISGKKDVIGGVE